MHSGSQFDGNLAFSGGGFMPSQATQATGSESSFAAAKHRDTQALLPLTVKQIADAMLSSDDKSGFIVDGVDVNNVVLVGMVLNKSERVTDVSFLLDDGTGRIDCHRWVNEAVDTKETEGIMDGMYVRVHGHLKGFQGKRNLSTFSIKPVTDFNEIAYHYIQCVYVHVYNTTSKNKQAPSTPSQATNSVTSIGPKGYQTEQPIPFGDHHGGLKESDKAVIDFLQKPEYLNSERGAHRNVLMQSLRLPLDKLMQSIRSLEDDGLIYSTVDEFHYKSTGNA